MSYWLTIHDPEAIDYSFSQYGVHLQERSRHLIDEFNEKDIVFIYETGNLPRQEVEVKDAEGQRIVRLKKGRKGIIGVVKISSSSFARYCRKWRDKHFIGSFDTCELNSNFVPLSDIREALPRFNPRIPRGLRKLKAEESLVMARLTGLDV